MGRRKLVVPHHRLVQDRRSKVWFVSYTCPEKGYTKKVSTGERQRAEAEQAMRPIVGEMLRLIPKAADYEIAELLDGYVTGRDGALSKSDTFALRNIRKYFAKFKPAQLNDGSWKSYRKWRTAQPYSNAASKYHKQTKTVSDATACRELNVLRAAVSWAKRDPRWVGLGHVKVILPNVSRAQRTEFLSHTEAEALVAACVEPHTRLFVLLALATAARHRALLGLKWAAVRWPEGMRAMINAHVSAAPSKGQCAPSLTYLHMEQLDPDSLRMPGPIHLDLGNAVGNKRKPVAVISPTNLTVYLALAEAYERRRSEYVIEWRGAQVGRIDLSDAYRRAGLTKPRAPQHVLKHTAISWMVQAGKELAQIAALTQTSVKTIESTYGHLAPKHYENVGDVLSVPMKTLS